MCDIWEEFRAALCISGGNRRTPPTLPSADLADGGGEGEVDLLSALPDDVLLSILSRLSSTPAAARTSVLSRRWRRRWAQLPVLWFPLPAEPAREIPSPSDAARTRVRSRRWRRRWARLPALRFQLPAEPARALPSLACARAALAQHSAPALLKLGIVANDADPGDMTAVLRLAAPRLTSELFFSNVVPEDRKDGDVAESGVPVELPCFDRSERILLYLGYLGLVLPRSGVFRKLTFLHLDNFRFHGACDIGDALSSARCPSLRQLRLFDAQGVSDLTICSESLLSMCLCNLEGLQQLTIVSPKLRELDICNCFFERQPVADITAPVLKKLIWLDGYDPQSVQLGELAHLRVLGSLFFADACYGLPEHEYNWEMVMLLQRFRKIPGLVIMIRYPNKMVYCRDWMEALTSLPVESLGLILETHGHAIGSCVFHFLKISTSIKRLILNIRGVIKEQTACLPGCFCHEEQDWETEDLFLSSLQELCISGLSGASDDLAFVTRLLGWTGVLKKITINFDPSATVGEQLCMELLGLSGPETCMKIYLYRNGAKVMYAPVG